MMGMQGIRLGRWQIRVGMMGMQGIRVGMRRIGVGMQGIRVGMWGTGVGMWGIGDGNEGNQGENLCIGIEMMKKMWRGMKIKGNMRIYKKYSFGTFIRETIKETNLNTVFTRKSAYARKCASLELAPPF